MGRRYKRKNSKKSISLYRFETKDTVVRETEEEILKREADANNEEWRRRQKESRRRRPSWGPEEEDAAWIAIAHRIIREGSANLYKLVVTPPTGSL